MTLFRWAVFAAGIGDAGDEPFAAGADEVEEVGSAVVDFAVGVEVEGGPDDGEIVVDLDERVVDALLDLGFAGLAYAVGEGFDGHLGGLAVAHEDHGCARDCRRLDGGCVARGHAGEHGVDGGEDGVFFGCGGVEAGSCADASKGRGERKQRHSKGDFHRRRL